MPFQQAFCSSFKSIGLTLRRRLNFSKRAVSSSLSRLDPIGNGKPYRPPFAFVAVVVTTVLDLVSKSTFTIELRAAVDELDDSPPFLSSLLFRDHNIYWSDEIEVVGCVCLVDLPKEEDCCKWLEDEMPDNIDCLCAFPGPFLKFNI